jgi:hypothetical protein
MSEQQQPARLWSGRVIACISLAISSTELLIFLVAIATASTMRNPTPGYPAPFVVRLIAGAWILGGLGSFVFALTGLAFDSQRGTALAALVVSIVVSLLCGTQMLV